MKFIIFILAIFFAISYTHSEDIFSDVYGEYCVSWKTQENKIIQPHLLLVKKNYEMEPILLDPIETTSYDIDRNSDFEFIDESGRKFLFSGLGRTSGARTSDPIMIQPEILAELPIHAGVYANIKKEDLLPFKNKVINAYTRNLIRCRTSHSDYMKDDIDTIGIYDFRVRILGDCTNTENDIEFVSPPTESFILWRVQFQPRQYDRGFSVKIDSVLIGDFFTNQEWLFSPSSSDSSSISKNLNINTNYLVLAIASITYNNYGNYLSISESDILLDTPKNRKYLSKKWSETTIIYTTDPRTIISTNNIFDFLR
jgi:hypothetical protein